MTTLFTKHLELSKYFLKDILKIGDIAIDATCGNGHDSLFIASCILGQDAGKLYTLDIQEEALRSAKQLIEKALPLLLLKRISFIKGCHSNFPEEIEKKSVKLIMYNLGYLPGGNKEITTLSDTTLISLEKSLELISDSGLISVTCYPGHKAGEVEEQQVVKFASNLPKEKWTVCHHRFINRDKSPSLLTIQTRMR